MMIHCIPGHLACFEAILTPLRDLVRENLTILAKHLYRRRLFLHLLRQLVKYIYHIHEVEKFLTVEQ